MKGSSPNAREGAKSAGVDQARSAPPPAQDTRQAQHSPPTAVYNVREDDSSVVMFRIAIVG